MDFFKEIFRFFIAREYSFGSKIVGLFSIIAVLFFIDNYLGFSFYYSTNQKLNQIKTIELLKSDCKENKELMVYLTETEGQILSRKNMVEVFLYLFSKDPLDKKQEIRNDSIINQTGQKRDSIYLIDSISTDTINEVIRVCKIETDKTSDSLKKTESENDTLNSHETKLIIGNKDKKTIKVRSRLWHTLSSSYLLVLLFIMLPFIPFFIDDKSKWSMFIGAVIFMIFDAVLIWLNQYIFGLIPLILGKPWINYILNFLIHSMIIGLFVNSNIKSNKNAP